MNFPAALRLPVLLLLSVVLAGCSHFGGGKENTEPKIETSPSPAAELVDLRTRLSEATSLLNRTLGILARMPNAGVTAEAYAAFNRDQSTFAAASAALLADSGLVRNNGNAYFAAWRAHTADIKDPEIKAIAEQRRASLEQRYNAMLPPLVTARAELKTFVDDTADLAKALAYDQTPAGVGAIAPLIDRTVERGETAAASLKTLGAELDAIIALLPPAPKS